MSSSPILIEGRGLSKDYVRARGILDFMRGRQASQTRAVDQVSISIRQGRTVGLVGESGSGKSTLGRLLLRLEQPTAGTVRYRGSELPSHDGPALRALRTNFQIVFQDPYSSLNPQMSVGSTISEVLTVHQICPRPMRDQRVKELLLRVGLSPNFAERRPSQLSGGQRQRVGIARALAVEPEFIVADEAVSALDVSMQAQILNLFLTLQDELGLTYLFISHDLGVVRHMSEHVVVMYLGRIVEQGPTEALFRHPLHPYTQALLRAVPSVDPDSSVQSGELEGDSATAITGVGCQFAARCPFVMERCRKEVPLLLTAQPEQLVACHLYSESRQESLFGSAPS